MKLRFGYVAVFGLLCATAAFLIGGAQLSPSYADILDFSFSFTDENGNVQTGEIDGLTDNATTTSAVVYVEINSYPLLLQGTGSFTVTNGIVTAAQYNGGEAPCSGNTCVLIIGLSSLGLGLNFPSGNPQAALGFDTNNLVIAWTGSVPECVITGTNSGSVCNGTIIFVSGSDRAADRWREDYAISGVDGLDLHHLYRAMAWLGEELPQKEQDGRTPFAPRCLKDVIEERLFAHRRDLLTRLDLVFMDTTSLYFEGAGGQTLGQHGYSKDHRPDLRQMIFAVLIDGDGRPVCSEMWPGNTADVTTLIPVIDRLRQRFDIARMCVIADRGMISAETVAQLEARRLLYILGVRERSDKLVDELVLDHPAPFVPLMMKKRGKEIDYEAKTVMVAGRRYIVCRNRQEAAKDAADRASIVAALERQLAKGDKALVGNTGFRRYLKTMSEKHFAIDPDKIEEEKKLDGIFVLRTNTDLNPLEAMLCYKQLWTVEQTFRTAKHLLTTRPIFHKLDETIRGHVFCSFLALVLKTELEERIAVLERVSSWPEIIADLDSLTETEIEYDGKHFIVRSAPRPAATLALRAAGVALPPTIRDAAVS